MASAKYTLQGKTVLITGAARGIGADAARRAAGRGARVAVVGLEPEELQSVAKDCGPQALWFEADVTDSAALEAAVQGTVDQTGGVEAGVPNPGIPARRPLRHLPHVDLPSRNRGELHR